MNKPLRILIAPDSMKESLEASAVADAIANGIKNASTDVEIMKQPMADGGEGTVSALVNSMNGTIRNVEVNDPLMRPITANYGLLRKGKTAVIEIAAASGLSLLEKDNRNPLLTSSYGTGELILDALNQGCRDFIIGLGGSATNDGGAGLMCALGLRMYDQYGEDIQMGGGNLSLLSRMDNTRLDPRLQESSFVLACDVTNPLIGITGASHVFGPQKGATPEMVLKLEQGIKRYAEVMQSLTSKDVALLPGAGAAGGSAASLFTFCNATIRSGFELIADECNLEEQIKNVDLVITAEGKIDIQTMQGKVPFGVLSLANKYNVPVIIFTGLLGDGSKELYRLGVKEIIPIVDQPMTLEEAIRDTPVLLERAGERLFRLMNIFKA